jgi:hypothetical protein
MLLTAADVRSVLKDACNGHPSRWARENGLSHTVVSLTLSGKREPSPGVLDALGLAKVTSYERKRRQGKSE